MYAIFLLSGDQAGSYCIPGSFVNRLSFLLSNVANQRLPMSLGCALNRTKSNVLLSGEGAIYYWRYGFSQCPYYPPGAPGHFQFTRTEKGFKPVQPYPESGLRNASRTEAYCELISAMGGKKKKHPRGQPLGTNPFLFGSRG